MTLRDGPVTEDEVYSAAEALYRADWLVRGHPRIPAVVEWVRLPGIERERWMQRARAALTDFLARRKESDNG